MLIKIRKMMTNQKGFTLIELMVVISIIGILAAIAIPKFSASTAAAQDAKLKADLRTVDGSIMQYYATNNAYPADKAALNTTYLASWPKDAKGTDLTYTYVANATTYTLSGVASAGGTAKLSPGSAGYVAW